MTTGLFSIVLCCHNGSETLIPTLAAVARMKETAGVEFIFVDNASADQTYDLFPTKLGASEVLRLREPRRGKSFALNTAIRTASGDYIIFMDDDVRPEPDWLLAYAEAVRSYPRTLVFCGQVRPKFAAETPEWLLRLTDLGKACGATPIALNGKVQPVGPEIGRGANLMIKRSALASVNFDEKDYNYLPQSAGGEDTQIVQALTASGPPALFIPTALVHHHVSEQEMEFETILTRTRRIGFNVERRQSLILGTDPTSIARRLRSYQRKLTQRKVRLALLSLVSDRTRWAELALKTAFLSGRADFLSSLDNRS